MKASAFKPIQLVFGWLMLLVFLGGVSPLGLALATILGELDPAHQVLLQPSADGAVRMVLHHEGDCSTHHHGGIARLLTVFSKPVSNSNPDHVLQFNSFKGLASTYQLLPQVSNRAETIPSVSLVSHSFLKQELDEFIQIFHPPPSFCGKIVPIGSIVLQI